MVALYYTDGELLRAPTGVEWTSIPKKGSDAAAQLAERARLIRQGSEFVETEAGQKLIATQDVEITELPGRMAQLQHGRGLFIKTPLSPIVSVDLVEYSHDGVTWQTLAGTALLKSRASYYYVGSSCGGHGWVRYTYTNGFPDAKLGTSATAAATTITLTNVVGLQPNGQLTIYDDDSCEDIRVAGNYTPGSTAVGLQSPLVYGHAAGVVVSGLPQEIRDACRLAIVHYVRARGRDAIAIQATGGSRVVRAGSATEDLTEAIERLKSYKRLI